MNVTGYTFGHPDSWAAIHTGLIDPLPLDKAMAAISEEIVALAEQGQTFRIRTITLEFEEDQA